MNHYRTLKGGGASQAQPSGNGGFWNFLGGLFSGIGSISIPSVPSGGGGTNLQPFQFPTVPNQQQSILNNPVIIIGAVIATILIIKIIKE